MEGGNVLAQTRYRHLFLALFLLLSVLILPDTSFANGNPYKIEINKRTNHLYLYKNDQVIKTYRVGTGKKQDQTPEGLFTIGSRTTNPAWRDSENNKIIPGGHEDNPLGKYWLGIKINKDDSAQTYGIHGTNNEASVPGHVSKGCIRLKNADIKELYVNYNIPIGTPVWIHSGVSNHKWLNKQDQTENNQGKENKKENEEIKPISIEIITTARVNIRQGLSTSTPQIGQINPNTKLTVTGETKNWYRVKLANGKIGFISKAYAKLSTEAKATSNSDQKQQSTKPNLNVTVKPSFTKEGSLQIKATLPNAKKASGKWKVSLNGKILADVQNEGTSYTYTLNNPDLKDQKLELSVEFNGTIDGKKKSGVKKLSYQKVEEKLKITPTFKENQLRLQASLKENQNAFGIWKIQIGETKRISVQAGTKLDETFDEVTFHKDHFPIKIEFKGFTTKFLVTAQYEKQLKVNLPIDKKNSDQKPIEISKKNNDQESKEKEVKSTENQEKQDEKSNDKENVVSYNGEQPTYQSVGENKDSDQDDEKSDEVAKDEDNSDDNDKGTENNEETSNQQQGGELPKTASHYPLGILVGFGIFMLGMFGVQFFRMKKEQ